MNSHRPLPYRLTTLLALACAATSHATGCQSRPGSESALPAHENAGAAPAAPHKSSDAVHQSPSPAAPSAVVMATGVSPADNPAMRPREPVDLLVALQPNGLLVGGPAFKGSETVKNVDELSALLQQRFPNVGQLPRNGKASVVGYLTTSPEAQARKREVVAVLEAMGFAVP